MGTPLPGLTRKEPRRAYPPGAHGAAGARRRRPSPYRRRLEEKQKVRYHYGVSEAQLRRYFARATRRPGVTGEALFGLLERRLDSVVFRLGFAATIRAARQLVTHGHVLVDGRRVDRPSYLVDPGEVIAVSERARQIPAVAEAVARGPEVRLPGFLELHPDDPYVGRVIGMPAREDVPFIVDDAAIVEFYAR